MSNFDVPDLEELKAVAGREGPVCDQVATPRQVALRFLLRREAAFAIPKSSKAEHVEENARAGDLRLTDLEITRIAKEFPLGPPPSEFPTL